jgi:hypothetical protein
LRAESWISWIPYLKAYKSISGARPPIHFGLVCFSFIFSSNWFDPCEISNVMFAYLWF